MGIKHDAEFAVALYADTVKRICFLYLKNEADTEDVFQNVFLKFILYSGEFESAEHEKAWIIRVSINACKDLIKSFFRKNVVNIDALGDMAFQGNLELKENKELMQAVLSLPDNYKTVIFLFYYEGYSAVEISQILHKNVNTIYTHLDRARNMLKAILGGELFADD